MIDWAKIQPLYERKAYRIVINHFKTILKGIPVQNVTFQTFEYVVQANIAEKQIKEMFTDIYSTIGLNYGKRIDKEIEKSIKAHAFFNEYLLNEILLFLSNEGGKKIVSVHSTLIDTLIKAVLESVGENATVIELQNAIYKAVNNPASFFKWQALRIARTETTFSAGFAAMKTAEQSNLVMSKIWISATDNRTRHDHLAENGQMVDFYSNFIMADGTEMLYPGDPKAPADQVINCRCTIGFKPKKDMNGDFIFKT